jgi:acyl carrier protein
MKPTRDELWTMVRDIVAEMVSANGIDPEDIQPGSLLVADLGFASVDTIHMMINLEDRVGNNLDLEALVLKDGQYVPDLSMGDLHDYVSRQLDLPA